MTKLELDGTSLTIEDLRPVYAERPVELAVSAKALKRVQAARALVEECVDSGKAIYGVTTGFGKLKNVSIPRDQLAELQRNLVLSHCCGVGDPLAQDAVRAMMLSTLWTFPS